MRIITEAQVAEVLTPAIALDAVREAHIHLESGIASNVTRVRARDAGFILHSLPAVSSALKLSSIKVYSSKGGMRACHVLIYSTDNGELLAGIEGTELGRLRTSAAAILGVTTLADTRDTEVAVIGSGYQGEGVIRALAALPSNSRPRRVLLSGRDKERTQRRAAEYAERYALEISPGEVKESLKSSPIIITTTTSRTPLFARKDLSEVRQITALGANSLIRSELDLDTVAGAASVYVDDLDVAKAEGGNLLAPIELGKINWGQVRTLGSALTAQRTPGAGYSVFCSHGLGLQDLYAAARVLTLSK